jgi:hypothetical protein
MEGRNKGFLNYLYFYRSILIITSIELDYEKFRICS